MYEFQALEMQAILSLDTYYPVTAGAAKIENRYLENWWRADIRAQFFIQILFIYLNPANPGSSFEKFLQD